MIVSLVLLIPNVLAAEIYKTIDENGRVVFSDKPSQSAEIVEVKVNSVEGPATVTDYKSVLSSFNNVVMYSTEWCGVCKRAKKYMQKKGVKFKEYDIEKSSDAKRKFKKLGGSGVPLILVGNQRMSGFSEGKVDAMLAKANNSP